MIMGAAKGAGLSDIHPDDRAYWPVEPGRMYASADRDDGLLRLHVDGYRGRAVVKPGTGSYLITLYDGDGRVRHALIAGSRDVVTSVAETMLAGAAHNAREG